MNNEDILLFAKEAYPYAVEARRFFHQNPEIGNNEKKTTAFIVSQLKQLGFHVLTALPTGCVGILKNGDGKTVALRADIDALPIKEETDLPFASKNEGVMHACGHDLHAAALLGTAKVLSLHKDIFHGTVKLIFQPDEEGDGGAKRLLESGVFENPKVDKIYGIHIMPELKAGEIAVKFGKSYAASDVFTVTFYGKSSHGAQPHKGRNALVAASAAVEGLEGLKSRILDPTEGGVISVCTMHSGTACNIIPETAEITGIIRTLGKESRQRVKTEFAAFCQSTALAYGCKAEVKIKESYPGVVNTDEETAFIQQCASKLIGHCTVLQAPTLTTEDFGYYLEKAPGCFFHVGVGSEFPLHNCKMNPDESALINMIAMEIAALAEI